MDNNLWRTFPSCDCLKQMLLKCGFDSPEYLKGVVKVDELTELEKYIDQDRTILNFPVCLHKETYANQKTFKFLPFHRILILNWSANADTCSNSIDSISIEHPALSPVLREMIRAALSNYKKLPTNNRYPDLLMDFAMYLYIMAGKASYEVICANIPIPKAGTIRKSKNLAKQYLNTGLIKFSFQLIIYIKTKNELLKESYVAKALRTIWRKQIVQSQSSSLKTVQVL